MALKWWWIKSSKVYWIWKWCPIGDFSFLLKVSKRHHILVWLLYKTQKKNGSMWRWCVDCTFSTADTLLQNSLWWLLYVYNAMAKGCCRRCRSLAHFTYFNSKLNSFFFQPDRKTAGYTGYIWCSLQYLYTFFKESAFLFTLLLSLSIKLSLHFFAFYSNSWVLFLEKIQTIYCLTNVFFRMSVLHSFLLLQFNTLRYI